MTTFLLVVAGLAAVAVVVNDATQTVLAPGAGAGPITRVVGRGLWAVLRRTGAPGGSFLRRAAGPVVLATTVVGWLVGLVIGFGLLLAALGEQQLDATPEGVRYSAWMAPYVAVTTLFTLGLGDVVPTTTLARVVVGAGSALGLLFVTLAVTYLLPVITSVTERRSQASALRALGGDGPAIVRNLSDRLSSSAADQLLLQLAAGLRLTAQRHLTYPVLHYFQTDSLGSAFAPAVAAFTEAATHALTADDVSPAVLEGYLHAVDELLAVTDVHISHHMMAEPPERLDDATATYGDDQEDRRCRLAAFVADSGWTWDQAVLGR